MIAFLIIAFVGFALGFAACQVLCVPTRELPPTDGPHTSVGQGDYRTDFFA